MFYTKKKIHLSPRLRYGVARPTRQALWFKIASAICLIIAVVLIGKSAISLFSNPAQSGQILGATDSNQVQAPQERFVEYTVKKDDTLFLIGQQYGVSWTTLMVINNLENTSLKVGQKLKIPAK